MSSDIMSMADQVIAKTYKRFPIVIEKGKECTVWDTDGRSYTDFVAGIAVCNLGHTHKAVSEALAKQANILSHVSNLYYTVPQVELASWLTKNSFADRVFFCNSGAEANEAAIKLARKYFKDRGENGRYRIISMEKSFHGRTMATLSATGQEKIKQGFEPVLEGFDYVPFNNIEALRRKIGPHTSAVLIEPVQGEGGVRCPDPEYIEAVRKTCDETGSLLIFDEIQTGIGRTGKLFAYEHFSVEPDIITLAKALGGGTAIGAMLAGNEVAAKLVPGKHASTFGGNALACAAGVAVIGAIEQDNLLENASKMGQYTQDKLNQLKQKHFVIDHVRGIGLMIGVQLTISGSEIVNKCLDKGLRINCTNDTVLRFMPPMTVTTDQIDQAIEILDSVMSKEN